MINSYRSHGSDERQSLVGKSLAIVSGKGGSGKTLIATSIALDLSDHGMRVLLVDADFGTGGLSYFLGFSTFRGTRSGLSDYIINDYNMGSGSLFSAASETAVAADHRLQNVSLISVGDHRRLLRSQKSLDKEQLRILVDALHSMHDVVIFDCRGGIDYESLAVCAVVDEIILVAETDAASIKATQYLSETLSDQEYGDKISGFILNKVMDDPTSLAATLTGLFSADYMASVPFDLETTRRFIKGQLPGRLSLFSRQVRSALPKIVDDPDIRVGPGIAASQFDAISLEGPEDTYGNVVLFIGLFSAVVVGVAAYFWGGARLFYDNIIYLMVAFASLASISIIEPLKKALGRMAMAYIRVMDPFLKLRI